MTENKQGNLFARIPVHIALVLAVAFVLLPFYMVLISTFKNNPDILNPKFLWWPKYNQFYFDGYVKILMPVSDMGGLGGNVVMRGFFNTLWMSVPTVLIGLFTAGLAGFAHAKLNFPFKRFLFSFMLFTMMLPGCVTLISGYVMYDTIGWTDTPLPLMIPGMFGTATYVFFMRQYMSGIPGELVESARIDGASNIRIYLRIVLPLSRPVFISLGLLWFIGCYNDYLGPLMYLSSPELYTLQIALRFFSSMYTYEMQTILSACILSILPLVLVFLFAQKYFIKGITMSSGLKG